MTHRLFRIALPFGFAALLALCVPAEAQQSAPAPAATPAPAKPKPPATTAPKPAAPKPAAPAAQTPPAAPAAAGTAQPNFLGQYGDWGAYSASPGGRKLCFALAKPATSQSVPAGPSRGAAFAFVSTRPAEKVKDEVSLIIGYPFKPNSEATVEIGGTKFALYTQADGAWIKNAAEETRMIEAMRKASDMVVKGTSGRGTQTTDTFSLKGLEQALNRVGQECK